jgi:hypothetical protein
MKIDRAENRLTFILDEKEKVRHQIVLDAKYKPVRAMFDRKLTEAQASMDQRVAILDQRLATTETNLAQTISKVDTLSKKVPPVEE